MKVVGYPLKGQHYYIRRDSAATCLRSLARVAKAYEEKGHSVEAISIYCADDEWVGTVLVQDPDNPEV